MLDRNWISELVVPLPDSTLGSFRLVNWSSYTEASKKSQCNNVFLVGRQSCYWSQLIKQHTVKTYGGVEVWFRNF
jgi:hypothetical protein